MTGYPAYGNTERTLENLRAALAGANSEAKLKIEKLIADLEAIKNNRTFMRTQKAEKVTENTVRNSLELINDPNDPEKISVLESDIAFLVEKVKTMVIRMT